MALLCFFSDLMMEEVEISKLCTSLEPTIDWFILFDWASKLDYQNSELLS